MLNFRFFPFLIILLFLTCAKTETPLRVLTLTGTPYERGLQHGQTLRAEIHHILQQWQQSVEQMQEQPFDSLQSRFLRHSHNQSAIQTWTPELMQEIRGIADGAGIDFNTMYLFQISEEFENYIGYAPKRCTALGVHKTTTQPTLLAQNMDPPNFLHGFPTILHIIDSTGVESFVFTAPGFLGLNGMNSKSIGITCNSLPPKSIKWTGLPVAFVVRGVLQQESYEEAVNFIHNIEHANGQNYILGGLESARCFECSTVEINEFVPEESRALTYHTNIYLVKTPPKYCSRLRSLRAELEKRDYEITLKDIQTILSLNKWEYGRPICNPFTYGSLIFILSDTPELLIAPGRPDRTAYQRLVFTNHF